MSPSAPIAEVVLPLLLPADADALWVADPVLAKVLADAGFEVAAEAPDLALVTSAEELGAAPPTRQVAAIVDGMAANHRTGPRLVDAQVRLAAHGRVRRRMAGLCRRLEEDGWPAPDSWYWDIGATVRIERPAPRAPVYRPGRYLRRAALVSGVRGPSLLEAALDEAAGAVGALSRGSRPSIDHVVVSEGSIVAVTDIGVLRCGLGSRASHVEHPAAVLRTLRPALGGRRLPDAVPALLGTGQVGRLRWSLESHLRGDRITPPLTDAQWRSCVELQVELRDLPSSLLPAGPRLSELTELLAVHARDGDLMRRLASHAERALEPLQAGVHHGDFWHSNLLGDEAGVTALLDWDSAQGNGLPFVDLLHLYTASVARAGRDAWGRAFVSRTLPWLGRADDPHLRAYGEGIGVPLDPATLAAAATGSWLLHLGYQLSRFPQRGDDPKWVGSNIDGVAVPLERFVTAAG